MADKPRKAWYFRWWAISIYVLVLLLILGALADDGKDEQTAKIKKQADIKAQPATPKEKIKKQKPDVEKAKAPGQSRPASISPPKSSKYEIVATDDDSYKTLTKPLSSYTTQEVRNLPMAKKFVYKVVVPPSIKTAQVRPTVGRIIADITGQDNDIDEIVLFFYSDKELVNEAYDVARAVWAPGGKTGEVTPEIATTDDRTGYRTTIETKDNLEEYLSNRQKSESKFGLSEDQRKVVFLELVAAEDRAAKEADNLYSNDLEKYATANRELEDKYKAEVRTKYGISEDTANQIAAEGMTDNWPTPEPPR